MFLTVVLLVLISISVSAAENDKSKDMAILIGKTPKEVIIFSKAFFEIVKRDEALADYFEVDVVPAALSQIYSAVVKTQITAAGIPNAEFSAEITSNAVLKTAGFITRDDWISIYGRTAGFALYYKDILTVSNAASLAKQYKNILRKCIRDSPKAENTTMRIPVIFWALKTFLTAKAIFNPLTLPVVVFALVTEMYTVAEANDKGVETPKAVLKFLARCVRRTQESAEIRNLFDVRLSPSAAAEQYYKTVKSILDELRYANAVVTAEVTARAAQNTFDRVSATALAVVDFKIVGSGLFLANILTESNAEAMAEEYLRYLVSVIRRVVTEDQRTKIVAKTTGFILFLVGKKALNESSAVEAATYFLVQMHAYADIKNPLENIPL